MTTRIRALAALATVAALAGVAPMTIGAHTQAVPTRIVSLSPTATEDLFAIGAGKQVVAVDDQSNYPANAPHSKLSGYTPNAEAIAAYNPDLVVLSADSNGIVAALGKLKIPTLLQAPATNLAGAYAQITALGKATGRTGGAAKTVTTIKQRIAKIVASVKKPATPVSFYEELSPDYYSATSKTFGGQLLGLLGLKNIADAAQGASSGYPKLSAEYIVGAQPDLVILADTKCCAQTAATVKKRPGWSSIPALKDGGVVPVSDDIASCWGPRIVDFLQTVATAVKKVEQG